MQIKSQLHTSSLLVLFIFISLLCWSNTTFASDCANTLPYEFKWCNSTCAACLASDTSLCQTCPSPLVIDDHFNCQPPNQHTTAVKYLGGITYTSSDMSAFQLQNLNSPLDMSYVTRICSPNLYLFDLVGFFSTKQKIVMKQTFVQTMQEASVRFYILMLHKGSTLIVNINDREVLNYDNTQAININNTFEESSGSGQPNFMQIPSLNANNFQQFFYLASTETYSQQYTSLKIEISVINSLTSSREWAFSDFQVLKKECTTCIKSQTNNISYQLGVLIGITAAVLFVLVIILICVIKIEEYIIKKEMSKNQKVEKSNEHIPLDALTKLKAHFYQEQVHQETPLKKQ